MVCVGIYSVLVANIQVSDNVHTALLSVMAVSYTHLDVYKRQVLRLLSADFTELYKLLERAVACSPPFGVLGLSLIHI